MDILVNNAAIPGPMGPVTDCSFEDWSRTLQVNLNSAFLCSKEAVPFMRERGGGRIINISSAAGVQPFAGLGAYSVSKAGLIMLTRTLSAELAPQITANCILPGMVVTDVSRMKAGAEALGMTYEAFIKLQVEAKHMNHLGRPTEASEVANTVLFLASGHAGSITGAVVNHGGGWF
ncbi:MAG: SDR family oxidoreductase [Deltaproteobacteria bacterium]|nr:SDR family oxidoreductase [Deltaproteobacteria bacterium]